MSEATFKAAAQKFQLLAALLWLVLAVRFAFGAVSMHLPTNRGEGMAVGSAAPARRLHGIAPQKPEKTRKKAVDRRSGRRGKAEKSLRLPLLVSARQERSEVFVNGSLVGKSPFLGEVSCRPGKRVVIEVLPPRGVPRRYLRNCEAQAELRIREGAIRDKPDVR